MKRVSKFSRSVENYAKLGQYFTDCSHAKALSGLFSWPDNSVCVLEPCIANAEALLSFCQDHDNTTLFGVELDKGLYESLVNENKIDYLLNTDFLSGLSCTNNAFSLAFANPPYGENGEGDRLESLFMTKISNYIKSNGLIVLIIPWYTFIRDDNFAHKFTNRFDVEAVYKFHEYEFKKFQQIALIGRKKISHEKNEEAANLLQMKATNIEELELLPMDYNGELIDIPVSSPDNISTFQTLELDQEELRLSYKEGSLLSKVNMLKKVSGEQVLQPPLPPKIGHSYLLGTTGFTSGEIGSEEDGNLHLQRGKVKEEKIIEHEELKSKAVKERIKTIKTTSMVLIEQCGSIIRF